MDDAIGEVPAVEVIGPETGIGEGIAGPDGDIAAAAQVLARDDEPGQDLIVIVQAGKKEKMGAMVTDVGLVTGAAGLGGVEMGAFDFDAGTTGLDIDGGFVGGEGDLVATIGEDVGSFDFDAAAKGGAIDGLLRPGGEAGDLVEAVQVLEELVFLPGGCVDHQGHSGLLLLKVVACVFACKRVCAQTCLHANMRANSGGLGFDDAVSDGVEAFEKLIAQDAADVVIVEAESGADIGEQEQLILKNGADLLELATEIVQALDDVDGEGEALETMVEVDEEGETVDVDGIVGGPFILVVIDGT